MTSGKPHEHGGAIGHPVLYELFSAAAFGGARRLVFTRLAALAGPRRGERFLDVGCGTGYLTRVVAPVVGPEGRVTGVDPSPAMVEYARGRAPANCDYQEGEGQDLPFPDGSFDAVLSSLAVHHIPEGERARALREMFRVLRPGGRLVVAEFRPPANPVAAGLARLLNRSEAWRDPYELLGTLIPDAGFRVAEEGDLPVLLAYVKAVRPA